MNQRNSSLQNNSHYGICIRHEQQDRIVSAQPYRPAITLSIPCFFKFKVLELKNKDNTLTLLTGWDSLQKAYFVHLHSQTARFEQTNADLPARKQNSNLGLQLPTSQKSVTEKWK